MNIPLQTLVVGKVLRSRLYDGSRYTAVTCPASDPYSHPAVLEVRSKAVIGKPDEEVSILCRIGGMQRKRSFTDKETGELTEWVAVQHFLDAVE